MSKMDWWQKLMRRAWIGITARLFKSRKNGNGKCNNVNSIERLEGSNSSCNASRHTGFLKLQDDVATCEYQDVQVLWNIVLKQGKTEAEEDTEDAEIASCSEEAKEQRRQQKQSWKAFLCPYCSSAHLLCFVNQ